MVCVLSLEHHRIVEAAQETVVQVDVAGVVEVHAVGIAAPGDDLHVGDLNTAAAGRSQVVDRGVPEDYALHLYVLALVEVQDRRKAL